MATRKLTIRLPEEDIDFAKEYAANHGLTMTQLIDWLLLNFTIPPRR
jgi:predicted DNA binding CopG/RHH family protein